MACFNHGWMRMAKTSPFKSNTFLATKMRMIGIANVCPALPSLGDPSRKEMSQLCQPLPHHRLWNNCYLSTLSFSPSSSMEHPGPGVLESLRLPVKATSHTSYFHTASSSLQQNDSTNTPVLPSLMDFPLIMWPSVIKTIRNWFFYHFVIRSYMDNEFNLAEFDRGARQAVSIVARNLVSGKFDELEGLVDPETLAEVKKKLSTFSVFQRELLTVNVDDIFFSYPYQIGIIIPDEPTHRQASQFSDNEESQENRPPQKRYVEITVVFHILRGFMEKSDKSEMKSLREFINSEDRNNVMVCNYRFFKDFTQGVENPTWIINMINHFLPADHVNHRN